MGEGIKQRENWDNGGGKQSLPLCLVKVRAVFFFFFYQTHTHPHTLNRLLTVSSLSGFVDGILGASQAYGGLQRLIQ